MAYTVYRVQLYIQAFLISASVMYMDVCMQHGGMYICTWEHVAGMGICMQ